jgi:hypothetical protein
MDSGTTDYLNGIWGSSPGDIFAVGSGGTILDYDGIAWHAMNSGATVPLSGVWASGSDNIYAVGFGSTLLHYNGSDWSTLSVPTQVDLFGIWGSGANDIFVVGIDGTILHFDGDGWDTMASGTDAWLYAVWGNGADDVFAVGNDPRATILHYDGSSWSKMYVGLAEDLLAVWGSGPNDVFAVGGRWIGYVLHYDGVSWQEMELLPGPLSGIWGSGPNDVFAVSYHSGIFHYDGTTWSEMTSGTVGSLSDVWGSGPDNVFAVGANGTILHYGGHAEEGTISGRVTSVTDGTGLPNVTVTARTHSTTTDGNGYYTLVVPPGVYTVKATPSAGMDYYANQRSFITVRDDETVTVDLKLTPITADTVDTLILANLQRMKDIGYDAGAVNQLAAGLSMLRSAHPDKTNMTATLVDLGSAVSPEIDAAYAVWNENEGDIRKTNALVDSIDAHIESLQKDDYPNLEYLVIVGSHEVIPMKARAVDSGEENDWAENLPLKDSYLHQIYSSTENDARGYYLTDSQYSDLSAVWNLRGLNSDKELIPELYVGRLVETPEQIAGVVNSYVSVDAAYSSVKNASIGTSDFLDSGAALGVDMGPQANTALLGESFSSELVPPVLETNHDIVFLGLHGTYNAMQTAAEPDSYFVAGASSSHAGTRDISGDLSNAVIATPGCHVGLNLGNQRYHAPDDTTPKWSDFPEEFASKRVGAYLASTGYGIMSSTPNFFAYSERLTTDFLENLLDNSDCTVGEAYRKAVRSYIGITGLGFHWGQDDKRVLAITTLYGIPNYRHRPSPETSNSVFQRTNSTPWLMPRHSEQDRYASNEPLVLDLADWRLREDGTVELPHATLSGRVGEPVLPVISIERTLPPGSSIRKITKLQDQSSYIDMENDIPLAKVMTLDANGNVITKTGVFTHTGFYPQTTAFTTTLGTANQGTSSSLHIVPVQYDQAAHTTRIWTRLSFEVEYDLGGSNDSDSDGLPDYWERAYDLDPLNDSGDSGSDADPDGDGLSNTQEYGYSTNPKRTDTDGDGSQDRTEVLLGADPNNPYSKPNMTFLPVVLRTH